MPSSVLLLHPWAGASLLPCAHLWALHPRLALVGVEGTVLSTPLPTRELLFLLCLCHPQAVPASTSPVQLSLKLHLGDAQTPVVLQFLCLDILSWEEEICPRSDACGYRWDLYPSFSPVGAVGLPHSSQVPASSCRVPPCWGAAWGGRDSSSALSPL